MWRQDKCRIFRLGNRAGFSLIELLIVISIIAILLGILIPTLQTARESAGLVRELSLGRQLGIAYELYAQDHDGELLMAYDEQRDRRLKAPDGSVVTGEPKKRWVWWLAPYFDDDMRVLLRDPDELNATVDSILPGGGLDGSLSIYAASVFPRFGLNHYYVGGRPEYFTTDRYRDIWGSGFFVRRISDEERPGGRISFTTAAFEQGDIFVDGYYRVDPPNFLTQVWRTLDQPAPGSSPNATGHVWPDKRGRVVSVMLDGHAEALEWGEVHDMRRWAPRADSPDWTMPPITGRGR